MDAHANRKPGPALRTGLGAIALIAVAFVGCQPQSPSTSARASAATSVPGPSTPGSPSVQPSEPPIGWRELFPSGPTPAAREDHTWTVDGAAAFGYLFGGRAGGTPLGDFWVFDVGTETWTQRPAAGSSSVAPEARFGHNAAWVEGVGLVIFGGQGAASFFNDLWAYDPDRDAWTQLPAGGAVPVPRYGSCAAVGPDGRLWISHGFTSEGSRFADTRAYDFATGEWTDETPAGPAPVERCLHGCWWTADTFNLYAGQTTGTLALGDWWQLTGAGSGSAAWDEVTIGGSGLPARNLYALTTYRGGHLVVGGQALDGSYLDDAWLIDHERAPAAAPGEEGAPPGRAGAEMITDLERDRILLFGGRDASGALADLWAYTAP